LNLQPNTVAVLSVFITGGQYTDSLKVVDYILLFVETIWEMTIRRREWYREFVWNLKSDYISAHAASGFVAFGFGSNMQWRRQGAGGAEAPLETPGAWSGTVILPI